MAAVSAEKEFQWGVRAYHASLYNEAIRSFEQSLAHKPQNTRTRYWLGLAYYRSGLEEAAYSFWNNLIQEGSAEAMVRTKLEQLSWKRGIGRELSPQPRHLISFTQHSKDQDFRVFARPSGVAPGRNGDYYVASFASNEVLRFSANAGLRAKLTGGLEGYNKPFDILFLSDRNFVFVSEFGANRITRSSSEGSQILRFGKSGRAEGELLGPQYLTEDGRGYLYVTEAGNRRVSKFDLDGNFILSFGQRGGGYSGLMEPAGIAALEDYIFVADTRKKEIALFDYSGNYLRSVGGGELRNPEGLTRYSDNTLLVADGKRLLLYSLRDDSFKLFSDLGGQAARVTKAVSYGNGIILVSDFDGDCIYFLSDFRGLYSNLSITINRINSDNFPKVTVDFTVEDTSGNPLIGLDWNNFHLTEGRRNTGNFSIDYVGNTDNTIAASLLIERSPQTKAQTGDIAKAVTAFTGALPSGSTVRLVGASSLPVIEAEAGLPARQYSTAAARAAEHPRDWQFDSGLRLAASELLNYGAKRAVVFITSGTAPDQAFNRYKLTELAQYLKNNGIIFYCVSLDPSKSNVSEEYRYLCEYTGGTIHHLYQPEGIAGIPGQIASLENGRYTLSYNSIWNSDFGNAFIPLEIEVRHFTRSGKDELGYYGPLRF